MIARRLADDVSAMECVFREKNGLKSLEKSSQKSSGSGGGAQVGWFKKHKGSIALPKLIVNIKIYWCEKFEWL